MHNNKKNNLGCKEGQNEIRAESNFLNSTFLGEFQSSSNALTCIVFSQFYHVLACTAQTPLNLKLEARLKR